MIAFICSRNLAEMFSALFVWMKLVGIKPKKKILADISDDTDKETIKSLKQEAKAEKQEYSQLKKLRWSLLINSDKLSDSKPSNYNLFCKIITTLLFVMP